MHGICLKCSLYKLKPREQWWIGGFSQTASTVKVPSWIMNDVSVGKHTLLFQSNHLLRSIPTHPPPSNIRIEFTSLLSAHIYIYISLQKVSWCYCTANAKGLFGMSRPATSAVIPKMAAVFYRQSCGGGGGWGGGVGWVLCLPFKASKSWILNAVNKQRHCGGRIWRRITTARRRIAD